MRLRAAVLIIAISAVLAIMAAGAFADDYYVATAGSNTTGNGSSGNPWQTVAYALSWIASNDPGSEADPHTIHIAAGTYDSSIGESYPLNMQDYVSLSGADEATTILDAKNAAYHVIYCDSDNYFTIENLTIAGGNGSGSDLDSWGGGIYYYNSSPTLSNCTISGNTTNDQGGAIFCWASSPTLESCTISDNTAYHYGGGILCWVSSPTLSNCTISGNEATHYHGGGIYCYSSSPTLTDCTLSGNEATHYHGGGIYCDNHSLPTLTNCTLSGNTADAGGGIYCRGGSSLTLKSCTLNGNTADAGGGIYGEDSNCQPMVLNSILWGDTPDEVAGSTGGVSITYSDIEGGWSGAGNIDENPLFVTGPEGACYLSHADIDGADSPCIDAGYGELQAYGLYYWNTTCTDIRTDRDDDADSSTGPIDMGVHYIGYAGSYVDLTNGNDSNSGLDWDNAFATIESAVVASHGCLIHIAAGTYYENIEPNDSMTFLGGYPPGGGDRNPGANETIIDGGSADTVVTIVGRTGVVIDGFTIQSGSATYGGGVYVEAGSAELSNCVIMDNMAEVGGGVFAYDQSEVHLLNCLIAHNEADYGAAALCYWESALGMSSCTVADNVASLWVGGVYCEAASRFTSINSILHGNAGEQIYGTPMNTFDITYSCVEGGWSGTGNIDANPEFVPTADPPFEYYLAHSGAQAGNSPCLDAGYGAVADYGLEGTTTCTDGREDGDDDSDGGTGPIDMGYHYAAGYDGQGDTSINLMSFEARFVGIAIQLNWETGAEDDCAGFALFREVAGTQDYALISGLIPAKGATSCGASYSFADWDLERGVTYNYWLVDIETSGRWAAHGPATATADGIVASIGPQDSGMPLR